ncbi:venom carboxylesterase-6-like [Penaeus japonicus]|uniref:venom carboxylesterase-6-like n=1 Tax=Penaeus japonicus TaxID=27405 RepID=UPI001C716F33|nr:venom carboxylesterase-6-like [Penaeus japonicus]
MSMRFLLASAVLLWLSAAAAAAAAEGETVQVQLQQGAIEGSRSEALGGRPFYSFKTIPYAEPPVGKLRFEDPVAAGAWEGVRNGSLPPPACPQPLPTAETQKEDCLYLNVYTPRPFKSNLPVMVWFLPGAFIYGSMGLYRPEYLLRKDVILVVVQARLGILGFLSTEDSELPGNLGLKDQTLALQWVQSNIHDLGGDPDKVTIFGQNSGSVSVHYHILSPMSKGLFKRAIMQSGSALCSWAIREDHRMMANHIGRWLGCPVMNSTELVNCLKKVPVEQLIAVLNNLPSPYIMVPRIDGEFLPAHPATLVREGRYNRVDIISGKTRDEGSLLVRTFLQDGMMAHMTENSTVLPYVMGFNSWDDNIIFLGRLVYYKYMGPVDFDLSKVDDMVKLLGDSLFNICSLDTTENHARDGAFGNRVFAYELQHRGQFTFTDLYMGPSPDWILPYIGHLDDLQYLFNFDNLNISLSKPEDFFVSRIMVDLWTNFAATGNPTPDMSLGFKWEPAEPSNISYLGITSSPSMKVYGDDQNVEFWRNLPKKMNKLLYPNRFSTN